MAVIQNPLPFQDESTLRSALRVPRPIDVVQIQSTTTTIFTARADADFQIEHLVATNVTGGNDFITLYLVPDGGTAGLDNTIEFEIAIAGKTRETLFDRNKMGLLQPGMSLQGVCSTNDAVNVWGYGYDYQGQYAG